MPLLLMTWQQKKSEHQQQWYWPDHPKIFQILHEWLCITNTVCLLISLAIDLSTTLYISRVVSRARDGGDSPQINNLPPQILERMGADPPIFDKILYSICIECLLFSGQGPPFLRYWGDFPLNSLRANFFRGNINIYQQGPAYST